MKKNSYLLELAKKWHSSSKIKNIPGVELDDVYQEIYLLWLELDKPGQFDESKLCTYYFVTARKLGYWQGCNRNESQDSEFGSDDDACHPLDPYPLLQTVATDEDDESIYVRFESEIEIIDDELDRLHHINNKAIAKLLGVGERQGRNLVLHYQSVIAQHCKDKISRAAKRQKANRGA